MAKLVLLLLGLSVLMYCTSGQVFTKASCSLSRSTGPCKARQPMFYWSVETNTCIKFTYGGCMGNNNRFKTASQCRNVCGNRRYYEAAGVNFAFTIIVSCGVNITKGKKNLIHLLGTNPEMVSSVIPILLTSDQKY
ncbi:unnamed protein product [Allacma fusca]|uniref:BPTI/Kunitz inhibitor domain-containing protein n=1 Tax=Allacma fusca TaxID=39272 RepID=A0A8J2JZ59_9HEXA|nr:unnamed protein product [Allacma fusca]